MVTHYLLRVGDGQHFKASSSKHIWGINTKNFAGRNFISNVKEGDLIWFVTHESKGHIIAVATFTGKRERILGPLIELTPTNEELGWTLTTGEWDTEIHYKDLYNISTLMLLSKIMGSCPIRSYNDKCKVDLSAEYPLIVRYSKITNSM